jgi:NADP-dependent 3-hydroxy acid dehydrogenase YdfG
VQAAVVTGAASGIGRALARALHARNARVVLADRDRDALAAVAAELQAQAVCMDVTSGDDYARLADAAGPVDLVCLNAGITGTHGGPVWETPAAQWQQVLDVNLGGLLLGLRTFVPRLLAAEQPGHLLVTASLAGLLTWPGGGAYAASKHAAVAVAEQAALSLAGTAVSVTVLCPALVRTGMSEIGDDPADVAAAALEAVARGTFLVLPAEWRAAVADRGRRLAAGESPLLPTPAPRPPRTSEP